MGRAARKGVARSEEDGLEPGGKRQHWTETHPDRQMWSPGRLAQARTQTQEEYEALYGRQAPEQPPVSERQPPSPAQLEEVARVQQLSDTELLAALPESEVYQLQRGAALYNKEKEEYRRVALRMNQNEYQGFVLIRDSAVPRRGDGPTEREELLVTGTRIEDVVGVLNNYVSEQLQGKNYRARPPSQRITGKISSIQARRVAESKVHGVDIRDLQEQE